MFVSYFCSFVFISIHCPTKSPQAFQNDSLFPNNFNRVYCRKTKYCQFFPVSCSPDWKSATIHIQFRKILCRILDDTYGLVLICKQTHPYCNSAVGYRYILYCVPQSSVNVRSIRPFLEHTIFSHLPTAAPLAQSNVWFCAEIEFEYERED